MFFDFPVTRFLGSDFVLLTFAGLEVKPGKPQAYNPKNEQGKIHVTQVLSCSLYLRADLGD